MPEGLNLSGDLMEHLPSSPGRPTRRPTSPSGRASRSSLRSVTVLARQEQGGEEDDMLMDRDEMEEMIRWETNELADHLKSLQEHEQEEGLDIEEWAQRLASLRQLLRERELEVQHLQSLLQQQQDSLVDGQTEIAEQARVISQQEERIRELLRQLDQLRCASRGASVPGMHIDAEAIPVSVHPTVTKQELPALHAQASDSVFVQLPAQSYVEYQDCGLWTPLTESLQQHPRRWVISTAVAALVLLVLLLATIIPTTRHRRHAPQFVVAPTVAATGASWIDLSLQLDQVGLVSYLVMPQSALSQRVAGTGATLMELLQSSAVSGQAIYQASAPAAVLSSDPGPQPGLVDMAVACGFAAAANASASTTVSVLSVASSSAAACISASSQAVRCARCPQLQDGMAYTLLLVAASTTGNAVSSVEMVNATTGGAAVNINSVDAPFVSNATATSFELNYKLNLNGTLHYAVMYDQLLAPLGLTSVVYSMAPPTSSAVLTAAPDAFQGGLLSNGSVVVQQANRWQKLPVQPPCVGSLCAQSLYGLHGSTAYRIYLVAVDSFGNADPVPAMAAFTTPPDEAPPALLAPTGPANITPSSFSMLVSLDKAGSIYYAVVTPKPGSNLPDPGIAPGGWQQVQSLPSSSRRRRGLLSTAEHLQVSTARQRQLAEDGSLGTQTAPGSLVPSTCPPSNVTCAAKPGSVFSSVAGLSASFDTVALGCSGAAAAGQPLTLPVFDSLPNNTLFYVLLFTEDQQANLMKSPAVYAVRTVDLTAPKFACGFPLATNITATSFALSALLTKPAHAVRYVVLPADQASTAPSAQDVMDGRGAGGAAPAAAGSLTQGGWLPWEAAGGSDARKMWASVSGLQGGGNYTAFLVVSQDGSSPSGPVAALIGVQTPNTVAPSFVALSASNLTVNEGNGTFTLQLSAHLDRPGQAFYAMFRNYSCIVGTPSAADVVVGGALSSSVCKCDDPSYCQVVATGSADVPDQAQGAAFSVSGDLSPLPFESLRNASDDTLKCFQGGLGQASDSYNIYLVAGNRLPTWTGLAPQCSSFAQAAASAAATGALDASCAISSGRACAQEQLKPDQQTLQSGTAVVWPAQNSSTDPLVWQPPLVTSVTGRPADVQLSLESGAPPAFTFGPVLPAAMQTASSFGMQFALDKAALVVYGVFKPMPIDASGRPQAPVLIATGRVPVFIASSNYSTGPIGACPWADGAMQPGSSYYISYVARDKYGRQDGPCPGQPPGSQLRVCTTLGFTAV